MSTTTRPDSTTEAAAADQWSSMMAIVQDRYGTSDVLDHREIPGPAIGDDEVLVRVATAGDDGRSGWITCYVAGVARTS